MRKTIKSNNFHPKVVDLLRLSKTPDHLKLSDNKPYNLIFTWITILIKKLFLNQVLRQVHFRLNSNYTNSTGFNATFPIKLTRYHPWLTNVLVVPLFPFFECQGPRNSRLNNCYEIQWRRPCSVMQRQELWRRKAEERRRELVPTLIPDTAIILVSIYKIISEYVMFSYTWSCSLQA